MEKAWKTKRNTWAIMNRLKLYIFQSQWPWRSRGVLGLLKLRLRSSCQPHHLPAVACNVFPLHLWLLQVPRAMWAIQREQKSGQRSRLRNICCWSRMPSSVPTGRSRLSTAPNCSATLPHPVSTAPNCSATLPHPVSTAIDRSTTLPHPVSTAPNCSTTLPQYLVPST